MSIILKNIHKTYNPGNSGAVNALNGIGLEITNGEMLAIMGKSGSGKSTLLHILGCLDIKFDGDYILNGFDVKTMLPKQLAKVRNKEIGIVLQNFGLIQNMSVYDNIRVPVNIGGAFDKKAIDERIAKLLAELKIDDKQNTDISELSGGQKQRTAIARALVNQPEIILADEPTGALDKATAKEIMDIFTALNDDGITVVVVTHDFETAQRCGRIVELADGKMI